MILDNFPINLYQYCILL